jgi:hypothetical protein
MSQKARQIRHLVIYAALGGIIGVLVLHPVNSLVVWMQYASLFSGRYSGFGQFAWERVSAAPLLHLMAMNVIFAALGAIMGLVFSVLTLALSRQARTTEALLEDLQMALPGVIAGGENERTEFKSTLRWDIRESRTNRSLEQVIAKTIAGFMNHEGGRLLIGVADDGEVLGIDPDLKALRNPTADEFERALIGIVRTYLGSAVCPLVRSRFLTVDGKTICWVLVERSDTPVFLLLSDTSKYFVRLGNSTRELNAAEAHDHILRRRH